MRAEIDVQGQARDDPSSCLGAKMPARVAGRGRESRFSKSEQVREAKPKGRPRIGQRCKQRFGQARSHGSLPTRQTAPGVAIRSERDGGTVHISSDAGAGSVGGGMSAFIQACAPGETDFLQVQGAECRADLREGEKGRADGVEMAGK